MSLIIGLPESLFLLDNKMFIQKADQKIASDMSLEALIALAEGDIDRNFTVEENGKTVGTISMKALLKALVRYDLSHEVSAR